MDVLTAYIADEDAVRANYLAELLEQCGVASVAVSSESQLLDGADVLFAAGDEPGASSSDELITKFARIAPAARIVVVTGKPLWELIRLAVRERAWMDVPRTQHYSDFLTRILAFRPSCPKIVMDDSAARCNQLLAQWNESPPCGADLVQTGSLGEALETAIDDRASVLLNLSISWSAVHSPGISTLIYSLCPVVIAIMVEADHPRNSLYKSLQLDPGSRFGVLRAPFHLGDIKSLVNTLNVDWPVMSPP